jgi:molybdopterin molybdotransferase
MTITYQEALKRIQEVAERCFNSSNARELVVPLLETIGRVAAKDHASPICTPPKDTSAMDGYAISSKATVDASPEKPVEFAVMGTIGAGDGPIALSNEPKDEVWPCVEIMTGAQFPESTSETSFDACVKIEDTISLGSFISRPDSKTYSRVAVRKPLSWYANRRLAGGDLRKHDIILSSGDVIGARHIMALASAGIIKVAVRRKLRVAVWSTGNELSEGNDKNRGDSQIFNSNGPYLIAALKELGVDAEYKGILQDDRSSLEAALSSSGAESWDLIITTGAVSKGKFDFIVPALEELRADIHFHGVAIRPGHPILFATTKHDTRTTPVFGLPGNPIATAACFRFLVVPFLRYMLGQAPERYETAQLLVSGSSFPSPGHLDCFRHGMVSSDEHGRRLVVMSSNQSPAVVSQFAASNCWVHIPNARTTELNGSMVACYPHNASLR